MRGDVPANNSMMHKESPIVRLYYLGTENKELCNYWNKELCNSAVNSPRDL